MKTIYKLSLLFLFVMGLSTTSNSQSSITIGWATDSTSSVPCGTPNNIWFMIQGNSVGYTPVTDSANIFIFFGDGTSSSKKAPIYGASPNQYWYENIQHTYTQSGIFTVKYLVIAPDGKRDSIIVPNEVIVADSCGNISGTVFKDANNNCVIDAGEPITGQYNYNYVELIYNGATIAYSTTDATGKYFFNVPSNQTYTIKLSNAYQYYSAGFHVTCPSAQTYNINLTTSGSHNNDFGLSCPSSFDLTGSFWVSRTRPGQVGSAGIHAWNQSCITTNSTVKFVLDPRATYIGPLFGYTPPNQIKATPTGDTLIWNNLNLNNSLNQRFYTWINLQFDTTFTLGDTLCWTQLELPSAGDLNPVNNIQTYCAPASASYDPNMKHVSPKGIGSAGYIANNQTMTYTVEFQNTGNDTAFNIYILDTISSNLNLNTLRILGSSHPMKLQLLNNNVLKFRFDNIHLVDSNTNEPLSHGYVQFSIDQQPNLTQGTEIKNKVGIYFDYSEPVITNTVLNTIDISLNIAEEVETFDNEVKLYPNPSNGNFIVETESLTNVMVTDLVGKVIHQSTVSGKELINLSNVSSGIYNVVFNNASGFSSNKLVIAK